MITTLIICLTIIICVIWITLWVKHMVSRNLPLFTYGECVWNDKPTNTSQSKTHPIGFADSTEQTSEPDKKPTDKEIREALMQDPITLCASLLRGEVDIDDVNT